MTRHCRGCQSTTETLSFHPPNVGRGDADEKELYYFTESGKLKYKPILILAPKDEIYQRLSQSGLVSSRLKRPLPVLKLVKKADAEIAGWYYYCNIELLQFHICHNLSEVKAIVEYHIRLASPPSPFLCLCLNRRSLQKSSTGHPILYTDYI